ncbi:MAG: KamA family radical SAM protein [Treponemataceae bacterium]
MKLPDFIQISQTRIDYISSLAFKDSLPFVLTPAVTKLLQNLYDKKIDFSSILDQILPSIEEENIKPVELVDPLGAVNYSITPHLIHQYKNRVLFLTTNKCFGYCRYCFRKNFTSLAPSEFKKKFVKNFQNNSCEIDDNELQKICDYLLNHSEVKEILFSGGDPLTLPDSKILFFMKKIRSVRPEILIRICTRSFFYAPQRFTPNLIKMLKDFKPLWIIPHINHPYEIDYDFYPDAVNSINRIIDSGISMQSQTVLLKGINDSVNILSKLFENLVKLGIKPGYLFQTDLAEGTSHFRVPLDISLKIYSELRNELSGLSLPVFAVDLPGGGGKFNLLQMPSCPCSSQVFENENFYEFKKDEGSFFYPLR